MLFTDGDFSLTTNNTAASTTRLFPKQWKVTGNGVSTSTLSCIVTDRAVKRNVNARIQCKIIRGERVGWMANALPINVVSISTSNYFIIVAALSNQAIMSYITL